MMRIRNLSFDDLLAMARLDWPNEVDLSVLEYIEYTESGLARYTIKGLGALSDEISDRHVGSPDEVIFRNLHDALFAVLHGVAAYATHVKIAALRPEAIRLKFDKSLHDALDIRDLGWTTDDYQLIQSYFSAQREERE